MWPAAASGQFGLTGASVRRAATTEPEVEAASVRPATVTEIPPRPRAVPRPTAQVSSSSFNLQSANKTSCGARHNKPRPVWPRS